MKKIYSILLVLLAAMSLSVSAFAVYNTYDMALEAGKVKFKINVKDITTGEPVPGVNIEIRLIGSVSTPAIIAVANSNAADGIAYACVSYNNNVFTTTTSTNVAYTNASRFDFSPSGNHEMNVSLDYKIRNFKLGQYAVAEHLTVGAGGPHYDDATLTGQWQANGATIEMDIYVRRISTVNYNYVFFDTSTISNASSFTTLQLVNNSTVPTPSVVPECVDLTKEFDHWEYNGSSFAFGSYQVTHNIGLVPIWQTGSTHIDDGAIGKIKFKVYMWDHEAYWANPKIALSQNYSNSITGPNSGRTVKSNYRLIDYQANDGWTEIPVEGIRFWMRTYPETGGEQIHAQPVGYTGYPDEWWKNHTYDDICRITTDSNGEGEYLMDASKLALLQSGYLVDCDPEYDEICYIVRDPDHGKEPVMCNWDLMSTNAIQGAGLIGVRYVLEGERHLDSGIQIGNYNDNDAFRITRDMILHGFEVTFYCYVVPAPIAMFDIGDGYWTTLPNSAYYPTQKFDPVNSAGTPVNPYIVVRPNVDPTPNDSNKYFRGWFEVRTDSDGIEYVSSTPFDFTRPITYSIVLRALYMDTPHTVRWAPEGWTGTSDATLIEKSDYNENGSYPPYYSALPTKANADFIGWDVYTANASGDTSFGSCGNYSFEGTAYQPNFAPASATYSMVYVNTGGQATSFWKSPVAVNYKDQIYVAKFRNYTVLTVTKSGMGLGDSSIFTITNGTETRKIVLTGVAGGSAVSQTLLVEPGTWTVTEETAWSWAYNTATSSQQTTLSEGDQRTLTFTNTAKTTTPKHDESSKNNVFAE